LAGGSVWKAIEDWPIAHDIDFFFRDAEQLERHKRVMNSIPYCYHVVGETKNKYNTTYQFHICDKEYNKTIAVQFVSFRFWSRIEELLDGFDFTACQFGFDGERIVVGDTALEDVRRRVIRFNNVRDSVATAVHLKKYMEKGFSIPTTELPKFNEIMEALKKSPTPKKEGYPRSVTIESGPFNPRISDFDLTEFSVVTNSVTPNANIQYVNTTINPQFYSTINIGGIQSAPNTAQQIADNWVACQQTNEDTPTIPTTVRLPSPPGTTTIGEL
jgi:hypothetical protein